MYVSIAHVDQNVRFHFINGIPGEGSVTWEKEIKKKRSNPPPSTAECSRDAAQAKTLNAFSSQHHPPTPTLLPPSAPGRPRRTPRVPRFARSCISWRWSLSCASRLPRFPRPRSLQAPPQRLEAGVEERRGWPERAPSGGDCSRKSCGRWCLGPAPCNRSCSSLWGRTTRTSTTTSGDLDGLRSPVAHLYSFIYIYIGSSSYRLIYLCLARLKGFSHRAVCVFVQRY